MPLRSPIFFHPDYTVGPGVSPGHAFRLAGCTAGGDLHPALKILIQLTFVLYYEAAGLSTEFLGGSPQSSVGLQYILDRRIKKDEG